MTDTKETKGNKQCSYWQTLKLLTNERWSEGRSNTRNLSFAVLLQWKFNPYQLVACQTFLMRLLSRIWQTLWEAPTNSTVASCKIKETKFGCERLSVRQFEKSIFTLRNGKAVNLLSAFPLLLKNVVNHSASRAWKFFQRVVASLNECLAEVNLHVFYSSISLLIWLLLHFERSLRLFYEQDSLMAIYVMTKRKCNVELPNNLPDLIYRSFWTFKLRFKNIHTLIAW